MHTLTPGPAAVLLGVLGLAVGSFLNVVIYRVPRNESLIRPGSHCPNCGVPIRARHNVPVAGWLVLRGRCHACAAPISVRYPLVEAGTAALFAALTLRFGLSAQLPAYLYLAAVAVIVTMIDFDDRPLPDGIVLPSYVVAVLLLLPSAADADWLAGTRAIAGTLMLLTLCFSLWLAYPNGVSPGDVKFAGVLGLYLGWHSWTALLFAAGGAVLVIGACGGVIGAYGYAAAAAGHPSPRVMAVPVGICLLGSAMLSLLFTTSLSSWYSSLLSR